MADRIVCITGGYGRLGKEFAKAFLANNDTVILTGRDAAKLETAASKLGCDSCKHDVTSIDQTEGVRSYIKENYNKLDVLINNAGIMRSRPVAQMPPKLFEQVIMTDLYGPYLSTHALLPLLKKSDNALIINIASTSGHRADPGASAYNAAKFGLLGFTEAIRKELRQFDIRVTSISPSSISYENDPEKGKGAALNGNDIAEAAVYLANSRGRVLFRDIEMWATNP